VRRGIKGDIAIAGERHSAHYHVAARAYSWCPAPILRQKQLGRSTTFHELGNDPAYTISFQTAVLRVRTCVERYFADLQQEEPIRSMALSRYATLRRSHSKNHYSIRRQSPSLTRFARSPATCLADIFFLAINSAASDENLP
jgi:hypothetical protein